MGKAKQSQRTKNNVRPSSSSRSAELLNNSVSLDGGLMAGSSGNVLPALFPTLAAVNLDQGLDPEFQMCIKKLNKKDPITRAKALQELCELVNKGNVDDVVAALPSWAHFYKTLTADTDRKVREMTQVCHGAIMRVCGRRAAPQLRALLPPWLQAQYDEHAPAQAHAQNSLKNTFPDAKLPEVISFCKAEVMAHLLENLIGNTEAIISKKIESPEERSLQMCRIVTGSLRGLEHFVPLVPGPQGAWLWAGLAPLLDSAALWKYAAHDAHQVRAAWFGALGRVVERFAGAFGAKFGLKLVRVLLNAARDSNALVAAQVWTCLLQFMHNVENWHQYLDKQELLVKRILDVLETGGWGDARHLSTMLLPLLAHLPQDILTKEFYEAFFNAMYKGLDKKNIMSSKSERQSWITSLAECLRYVSIQQNDFVVEVVTSVHRTWLEKVLCTQHEGQTRNNLIKHSAANMTSLVKYWLKQSKEENSEKYDQLLRNFWQNIGSTVLAQIDRGLTELGDIKDLDEIRIVVERLMDGHILLLQSLKTTFLQEVKKQQSIKFNDDGDTHMTPEKKAAVTQACDAAIVQRYKHNLDELVHKICPQYFELAEKGQVCRLVLPRLMTLLVEFDSKDLFVALARHYNTESPYKFYDKVMRSWLTCDTMRCKEVVDIVFLMMKYLSEEEQDAVFDSFVQLSPAAVEWCLSLCASHPHVQSAAARRWARGPGARAALEALAARALRAGGAAAALLLACLADAPGAGPLMGHGGVRAVLRAAGEALAGEALAGEALAGEALAGEALAGEPAPPLEAGGALAARLVTSLAAAPHAAVAEPPFAALVLRLFRLNVRVPRGASALSLDTWCEIRSSWQDGAAALPDAARSQFLRDAALLLHTELFNDIANLKIQKIEHIVSLCPHLFNRSVGDESDLPNDVTEIITFTKQIFDMDDKETEQVETCALHHQCVSSQMNCVHVDDNIAIKNIIADSAEHTISELSEVDIKVYANKFLFRAIYLRTLLLHKIASVDDESEQKTWCNALLENQYIASEYLKIMYHYMLISSLNEGFTFWRHHHVIEETKQKMDTLLADVIAATSQELRHMISAALSEMANLKGYFWAFVHRWYSVHALTDDKLTTATGADSTENSSVSGNGFFHTLQADTKWSSDPEVAFKTAYLIMLRSWNVAHSHLYDAEYVHKMTDHKYNLDVIVEAYYTHQSTMLYEMDISAAPWAQVVSNAAVAEYLTLMVQRQGWETPQHHWDFTTITLCSLVSSMYKSIHNWGSTKVAMLSRSVLRLFSAVREFCAGIRERSERQQPAPHVFDLIKEWKDMFAPDTHDNLFSIIKYILDTSHSMDINNSQSEVLCSLIPIVPQLKWHWMSQRRAEGDLTLRALAAGAAAALLRASHPAHKYLAYSLLDNLARSLVLDDSRTLNTWSNESADDDDVEKPPPELLLSLFDPTFKQLQVIVETALNNIVVGEDYCELVSMSDCHSMTLSWLLLADVMATMFSLARGDLTHFYIQIYREGQYTAPLLTSSLRLLPGAVFEFAADNTGTTPAPPHYSDWFTEVKPFSMYAARRGADVPALACRGVLWAVCGAGCGPARSWWGAARARPQRLLERVVAAYVAPRAIRDQLYNLRDHAHEVADTEIRIAWSSNEVVCLYSVEESTIELRVWLARAHPLTPPRLAAPALASPGHNTHWLALYLAYQNGTLLNALKMWTQAVNARVEKSPQCYICYCRLHPATGRLPRVPCHQCKNKFHNLCLRKWFATSSKSNCPLCRATF